MRCIVKKGMTTRSGGRVRQGLICGLAVLALAGCQENSVAYAPIAPNTNVPKPAMDLSAPSGVPVTAPAPVDVTQVAAGKNLGSRPNPFALLSEETEFDKSQMSERFLASAGGYDLEIVPTLEDPGAEAPRIEPVPNWRLSGVLVGNGVMALLDTGSQTYEIRPGMQIPGTEWRVVAIDADRALLAREGNKLPKEFYVGLSGPITGPGVTVAGGAAGGGGAAGNPRGGSGPGGAPG
jgi:hypothetical protein